VSIQAQTTPAAPNHFSKFAAPLYTKSYTGFAAVKAASLNHLDMIVERLLPGGKRKGKEYVARNPTRADAKAGSFKINMRTGVWKDFATGDVGTVP
jgi:putative DNA primase/helicase